MKNITRLKLMAEITDIILEGSDLVRWINDNTLSAGSTCKSAEEFMERCTAVQRLVDEIQRGIEEDGVAKAIIRMRFAMGRTVAQVLEEFQSEQPSVLREACEIFGRRHEWPWIGRAEPVARPRRDFTIDSVRDFIAHAIQFSWTQEDAEDAFTARNTNLNYANDEVRDEIEKFLLWMEHNKAFYLSLPELEELLKDKHEEDVTLIVQWVRLQPTTNW